MGQAGLRDPRVTLRLGRLGQAVGRRLLDFRREPGVIGVAMRILFLSGVDVGGAPRSTWELAGRLAERDHEVAVVLGQTTIPSYLYELGVSATIKLRASTGTGVLRELLRPFGRRGTEETFGPGLTRWHVRRPENMLGGLIRRFRPDVIVANSFPREQLRWIERDAIKAGVPWVLYVREDPAVRHLTVSGLAPALVLANSEALTTTVRAAGRECVTALSVVDAAAAAVVSTRTALVMVNPVPENRPEIMLEVSRRRPDIPCVLQESWPLDSDTRALLAGWEQSEPNLTVRPSAGQPYEIYRDARILVATYPAGRPRVVFEAQSNGIPVVGLNQPAMAEAVGPGGVLIEPGASDSEWAEKIIAVWDDPNRYNELATQAVEHARRPEVDPGSIVDRVEESLRAVVGATVRDPSEEHTAQETPAQSPCAVRIEEVSASRPLVSVIVPVYMVEEFLDACVDSILGQTYPVLDVVLVDDGSPDACPRMCDEWAERDARIKVVHQPNGGLSSARNTGLDHAAGEWITFVDSDDVLGPDAVAHMVGAALASGADAVATEFVEFSEGAPSFAAAKECLTSSGGEVLEMLVVPRTAWSAWGKLFRASILSGVRFTEGTLYEDVDFAPRVFGRAKIAVLSDAVTYGYRQRTESIMGMRQKAVEVDLLRVLQHAIDHVAVRFGRTSALYGSLLTGYVLHASKKLERSTTGGTPVSEAFVAEYRGFIRRNWADIVAVSHLSRTYKASLALSAIAPRVFRWLVARAFAVKPRVGTLLRRHAT